ncbi:MAG TPA: DUF6493 family protein [Chroococcales cyanobacterium]
MIHINQRNELPMFSAPTHSRGWLDPAECVRRWEIWRKRNQMPEQHELAVALLRLPLSHLDEMIPEWSVHDGEFWDAVRFALGRTNQGPPQNIGSLKNAIKTLFKGGGTAPESSDSPLWAAARAAREREGRFALFPEDDERQLYPFSLALLTWGVLQAPAIRHSFVRSGIGLVSVGLFYDDKSYEDSRAYFDVLSDRSFEFDQPAYRMLALGLAHQNIQCVGLARDIAISRIDDDELDVAVLSEYCAADLFGPYGKGARLANSVMEIARVGPKHADAARQILEGALTGGEKIPRDLSAVLEALNELLHSENSRLENPRTIEFLMSLKVGGKTGKLVKELTGR